MNQPSTNRRHWDSYAEFLDAAEKPLPPSRRRWSRSPNMDSGCPTFAAAMKLAREGWPEALERLRALHARVTALASRGLSKPEPQWDVWGDYPDVGRFVEGDPECMIHEELHEDKKGRIYTIVANVSISGGVSHEIMFMRGAAMLALVDLLEGAGHRCEVRVIESTQYHEVLNIHSFTAKHAHDPLEMDRLAFCLCHTSIERRMFFAVQEADPVCPFITTLGYPAPAPEDMHGDLYMSEAFFGKPEWKSEAGAAEWVRKSLIEQGVAFD